MSSKLFWLSIIGIIISFFGGFYLANSLNGNEILRLQAENERLKKGAPQNPSNDAETTLSDEEIRQRIAEADRNPDKIDYQRNLGLALLNYGILKQNPETIGESARLLQRAYDGNPKDFDVLVALGTAYYDIASLKNEEANFIKAREYYAKALEIKPENASVRADYGSTYVFVNAPDFQKGTAELDKALANDPKNQRALLLMTQVLVKQNKIQEAETFLARLKALNPQAPTMEEITTQMAREQNNK